MTIEELMKYDINEVLSNQDLLYQFKSLYKEKYGVEPSCTSCSITSEFRKLFIIKENMQEKTFKYKQKGEIISYTNNNGRKIRSYDNELSEEFVIGYLSINNYTLQEEVDERMKEFKILPEFLQLPSDLTKNLVSDEEIGNKTPQLDEEKSALGNDSTEKTPQITKKKATTKKATSKAKK